MKKSKFLCLLLAVLLVFGGIFIACDLDDEEGEDPNNPNPWTPPGGGGGGGLTNGILENCQALPVTGDLGSATAWEYWVWGNNAAESPGFNANLQLQCNTEAGYNGSKGIQFSYATNTSGGGFGRENKAGTWDVSAYTAMKFRIKANDSKSLVYCFNLKQQGPDRLVQFTVPSANTWHEISIPVSSFSGLVASAVKVWCINVGAVGAWAENRTGEVYLDSIWFE